jgi:hypothetical protein
MSEKMKSNLNNWLLTAVTVMIALVSYIYINKASADTTYQKEQTKVLQTLVIEMTTMKTANTYQHQIITNSVEDFKIYSDYILETQIVPNTDWRLDGEPRLRIVEKKIGIY